MGINLISATTDTINVKDTSMNSTIQNGINTIVEKDLVNEEEKIKKILFDAAKTFLDKTEKILKYFQEDLNLAQHIGKCRQQVENSKRGDQIDSRVSVYYAAYRQLSTRLITKEKLVKEFYKIMTDFHKTINLVLQQKVEMVFVFYNRGNPIIIAEDGVRFLKPQLRDGTLNMRYSLSQKNIGNTQTLNKIVDPGEIEDLTIAYKETRWRFNYTKRKTKKLYIVMYQIPEGFWHGVSISSMGDINEAYATFALQHLNNLFVNGNIEQKVRKFLFGTPNIQGVFGVDNESGTLAGDTYIMNKQQQQIAVAVKSDRASIMSIQQMLNLAQIIISYSGKFGKSELKEIKDFLHNKTNDVRNKIIEDVDDFALSRVNQAIWNSVKSGIHAHTVKNF